MSGCDDDDFWANEDFVATIENVVKKAEQASAARHGTQATPAASITPQIVTKSRTVEASPFPSTASRHDIPLGHGTFNLRPANGPGERFHGNSSEVLTEDLAQVEFQGSSRTFRASPHQQRGRLPLQSLNHLQNPSLASELKDVHSHPPTSKALNSNFMWRLHLPKAFEGVQEVETERYREVLAEKDGAISVLRSRIKQAEQQLDELRKRTAPQNAPHPSSYQQQLDLERLSLQLMFKDHELTEAHRARAEKEKHLNVALAETDALKEELERLKKLRQIGPEFKLPGEEGGNDVLEKNVGRSGVAPSLLQRRVQSTSTISNQGHDLWSPLCVLEGTSEGVQVNSLGGRHGNILRVDQELGGVLRQDGSTAVETLIVQTEGNGCMISDGKQLWRSDTLSASADELRRLDGPGVSGTIVRVGAVGQGSGPVQGWNNYSRLAEMYYSLQQVWGFKGVNNEGICLLSKIYTSCKHDLYVLLSSGESQVASKLNGQDKGKGEWTETMTISEKLHTAMAKVTNGFAHSEVVIPSLFEFCKLDNLCIVGNALRVLRCVLQHDGACRQKIVFRGGRGGVDHYVQLSAWNGTLEKKGEETGFISKSAPNANNCQMNQVPVFLSPRIRCRPQVDDDIVQNIHMRKALQENGVHEGACELRRPVGQLQQSALQQEEVVGLVGSGGNSEQVEELNILVKWIFHLALTSMSPIVKFEAVAIIGVLIVNSEPLVERAMFGSLLCHGGIELLLKESAGASIQLQAIRLVHLLLHCPILFQRFCDLGEGYRRAIELNSAMGKDEFHRVGKHPANDGHCDEISAGDRPETARMATFFRQQPSYSALSRTKLLDGIADCLKYTGSCLQGHVLRRSVIRLLAFIATSGDSGVALLMLVGTLVEDTELGQTCEKDDPKMEGMVCGESASGQQIIGDGLGSTRCIGLDVHDRGRLGLANERVNYLERLQTFPQRLVALIDSELDIDDSDGRIDVSLQEERDCLMQEALMLLCRLASHRVHAPVVIGYLISNKDMARLTLSVTNRLLRSRSNSHISQVGQKPTSRKFFDTADLARDLRRRVLSGLAESKESR